MTDPTSDVQALEKQGYVLVNDPITDSTTFSADANKNVWTIHLIHGTSKVSRQKTISSTVHYVYADNTPAGADRVQTMTVTENRVKDNVTGTITWSPAAGQKFADVTSPTIPGYTPDQAIVPGATVDYGSGNVETTVTYNKEAAQSVTEHKTVSETVHYVYADGTTARPDVTKQVTLTRHGEKDPATGQITWGAWSTAQLPAIDSPVIEGYTPDPSHISAVNVDGTAANIDKTVTYTKNATPDKPERPDTPVTPDKPDQASTPDTAGTIEPQPSLPTNKRPSGVVGTSSLVSAASTTNKTAARRFPQTGNQQPDHTASLAGLLLATTSALLGLGFKRKHQEDK